MAALATLRTAYTSSGLVLVTGDFPADSCGPGLQRLSPYETRDTERSAGEWSFLLTLKASQDQRPVGPGQAECCVTLGDLRETCCINPLPEGSPTRLLHAGPQAALGRGRGPPREGPVPPGGEPGLSWYEHGALGLTRGLSLGLHTRGASFLPVT